MSKINAVILKKPGDYEYTQIEKPICDEYGILIKVMACGLCGSDLRTLKSGHKNVQLPAVLGHEVAGRIVEVGKYYCGEYKVGENIAVAPVVYCGECDFCKEGRFEFCENIKEIAQNWPGGFAEYMAIPPEALNLGTIQRIPDGMEYAHAAISEPPSSCVNAQEKLEIGIEDTVVIIGAGPVGCMHVCIAKARGAKKVILADINANRLKLAEDFEPDVLINTAKVNLIEEVKKLTDCKGAEVIITANPVGATQVQAIEMAKKAGRIALFGGLPHGNSKPGLDSNLIHYKGISVIGTSTFSPKHNRLALELIKSGKLPAEKIITHRLPLSEFAEGVRLSVSGQALKVVFDI